MTVNLNLGIDNKVDAINLVLESIGSVGINSEEEIDYNIDAADADKVLDAMSQKIQSNQGKGWWFNREEFHKFSPDPVNGFVTVPNTTLSCYIKRDHTQPKLLPVTMRGQQLFDAKSMGYDMSSLVNSQGVIECILVMFLPFDYLPSSAKYAITDAARLQFVNSKESDMNKMKLLSEDFQRSHFAMIAEDAAQKKRNIFNNPNIKSAVHRAGGYNNN